MNFSYNWLKEYINLPKPDKLAELLAMRSFEVENIEKKARDYFLDIDILPNRAHDCLSYYGLAREIRAITGTKLKPFKTRKLKKSKGRIKQINFDTNISKLVLRYCAIVIEGVKVKPSPKWLKERIESTGRRSINNIVDLTNYLMLETGQPFHAFDYDKIKNQSILLRGSKEGEKLVTLDGTEHVLVQGIMIIENSGNLIDLVGIMGGKTSEIDKNTKNIVLQAGNFDSNAIYRAVRDLNFRTEASDIYSQGIDPNLTIFALERANFLFDKIGGGKIVQFIDVYPKKVRSKKIKLDLNYLNSLLGVKISPKEINKILQKLEFKIKSSATSILQSIEVEVPTWRLDISIKEDLIEEIGRIYGYEKIRADFPIVSLIPPKRNSDIFWEDMSKNILKECGFNEMYNYSFIGEKETRLLKGIIRLENPISSEYKYLRPSLIPNLLKNIESNFRYFDNIKAFELGKIFFGKNSEKRMLTGFIAQKKNQSELFYTLKGAVDSLLNKLGISDIYYDDYQQSPEDSRELIWNIKKSAEIKVGGEEIGFLGEISHQVLDLFKIKGKAAFFDIDFEKLQKLCKEEHEYQPISQHPAAVRDIAILVPRDIRVVDVLNKINVIGGPIVRDVDLFDIYEGEELPDGKKNLAFHIIYQADDRTLSSKEIDIIQDKIIKGLEDDLEWEVRK